MNDSQSDMNVMYVQIISKGVKRRIVKKAIKSYMLNKINYMAYIYKEESLRFPYVIF